MDKNLDHNIEVEEMDYILPEGYNEETGEIDDLPESNEPTIEPEEKEESSEDETEEEATEAEEAKQKLSELLGVEELKVNKEIKRVDDMTTEDLKEALQKGLAYDTKVGRERDKFQKKLNTALDSTNEVEEVAKMFDMSTEEMLTALKEQHYQKIADSQQRNIDDVRKDFTSKDRQTKMVEQFIEKYPDADVEEVMETLEGAIKNGENLTNAYEMHTKDQEIEAKGKEIAELTKQLEELQSKVEVKERNAKNKKKAVVKSIKGSEDMKKDDFLEGLFG